MDATFDPLDEALRKRRKDAAAEHDRHIEPGHAESADRTADPRHHLVGLTVEELDRDAVAIVRGGQDDRRDLSKPVVMKSSLMEGDGDIAGATQTEVIGYVVSQSSCA